MANKRLDMLHLRQLLRLYTSGVSKLRISLQLGVSRNTVKKYINLYHQHQVTLEELQELEDEELDDLFGASQLPVSAWHEVIGEQTIADAILDRMVHNSLRIDLKGESLRRKKAEEKYDGETA